MIRLYQFAPLWGLPSLSPFCMKVDTYLRMTGLPYESVSLATPLKAPKKKLPFVEDGDRTIADSAFIIDYLKEKYGHDLDRALEPQQRAVSLAMRRLLEENLYWCAVYTRWEDKDNWPKVSAAYFSAIAFPLRLLIARVARAGVRRQLLGHGIGRHSAEEIMQIGNRDLTALSDFLAEKPFFMGEEPSELDATAYAFLAHIVTVPLESPLRTHAMKRANLVSYCERMRGRYYDSDR